MGLLDNLLAGGQQRQDYDDFVNRYDQGAPWEGISDDEAVSRHEEVASQLSPEEYEASAREAFSRLSPDERQEVGRELRQRARGQNLGVRELEEEEGDDRFQDAGMLAQVTSRLHGVQPGILGQLLGGGGGGGNPLAKGALGGIAASAVKRMMAGR